MKKEIKAKLEKAILHDLEYLDDILECTPEREQHVEELLKLLEALENDEHENKKVFADAAKIGVGVGTTILGYFAYGYFQHKVLKFEEYGRIVSTAGRDLKLPRFMK